MSRPALAASRGVRVIDLLMAFPERRFSLTEIARAIEVNRASCHAILMELEHRGYLSRHISLKTYWLGPALAAVGQPVMLANPILERARSMAERLRADLGLPVLLSTKIADEVVCVFSFPDDDGRSAGLRPGDRVPLVPPIGMSFVAWLPPADVDAWIKRRVGPERPDVIKQLHDTLALIRARGFHVSLRRSGGEDVASILARAASNIGTFDVHRQVAAFVETLDVEADQPEITDPVTVWDTQLIAAPVIDLETRSIYNLCVGGFPKPLSGGSIAVLGRRLAAACLEIIDGSSCR